MEFELESEMVEPVKEWLRSQELEIRSEFPLPWGTCDLMAASFVNEHVATRIEQRQELAIGSLLRASLLTRIPDETSANGITLSRLRKLYEASVEPDRLEGEMRVLLERKFVHVSSRGSYRKINGWMPLHDRMVAVELKLSRIADVFHQALRNQPVANESYVALPLPVSSRIVQSAKVAEFKKRGIGILGVSKTGCFVLLKGNTRKSKLNNALQLLCADRFLRDRLTGTTA